MTFTELLPVNPTTPPKALGECLLEQLLPPYTGLNPGAEASTRPMSSWVAT